MDFKLRLEHALDLTNTTLGTLAMACTTISNTTLEIVINGHHGHVKALKGISVNGVHGVHVQQHVAMESVRAKGTVMVQLTVRCWDLLWTGKTAQDVLVNGLNGVNALKIVMKADVLEDPENARESAADQNHVLKKKNAKPVQFMKIRVSTI